MSDVAAAMAIAKARASRSADDRKKSGARIEHESGAANTGDQRRYAGGIDFAAQISDMHVDDVGFRDEAVVPDPFEQHGARDDLAGAAQKIFEQLELTWQQLDRHAVALHGMLDQIHFEPAGPQHGGAHVVK